MSPSEQEARQQIDALLTKAGWLVQDATAAHIHAGRGVAIREFPLSGRLISPDCCVMKTA